MPSVNDNFADATDLGLTGYGSFTSAVTDTTGNTTESGEPTSGGSSTRSAWWKFTPTVTGTFQLRGNVTTAYRIYTGTVLTALTVVASRTTGANTYGFPVTLTSGTTYSIQVGNTNTATLTVVALFDAAPANDDFANATVIDVSGGYGTYTPATVNPFHATTETSEPAGGNRSVWWKFTPPSDGTVETTADRQTRHCLYSGASLATLTELANISNLGVGVVWDSALKVTGGTTYHVRTSETNGTQANAVTAINLSLYYLGPDANDDFANALTLDLSAGDHVIAGVESKGYTKEASEPGTSSDERSRWYIYTPTADGTISVSWSPGGAAFASIYTGSAIGSLTDVSIGSTSANPRTATVTSGTTYRIQVGFSSNSHQTKTLTFSGPATAPAPATMTLAGNLPTLTGAFDLSASTDATLSLAGDLSTLTGAFDLLAGVDMTLAGDLSTLTGVFDLLAGVDMTLAGDLSTLTGVFDLALPLDADMTLAGDLSTLTAAFDLLAGVDMTLAGDLSALTGVFDLSASADMTLAGDLSALTGVFDLSASADMTLAGDLPSLTGAFTLETTDPTLTLAGDLPGLTGTFDLLAGADMALAGDLPALVGAFIFANNPSVSDAGNRAGGRNRGGLGVAVWEPAVAMPPDAVNLTVGYEVAAAFGTITMVGAQPTYTVATATAPRTRTRLVVRGKDVTFFRDVATPAPSYQLLSPLLYGPAVLVFPQVAAAYERVGVGELAWLRKGAPVKVQRVNDAGQVVATDYRGVVVAFNADGGSLTVEVGGQASGRAALVNKQVPIFRAVRDVGLLAYDAIRALGLRFKPRLGPTTGIDLARFGGMSHLDYVSELCAKAWTRDGNQWTIMPDADGVYGMARKDTTTIDATVYLGDAWAVGNLRRDIAEEPNRIFMTGVDPDGRRLRNAVYPGLNQGPPPPYPMNDNSTFGEGTTNDDTDTGDGISVMVQRLRATKYLNRPDTPGGYDADATRAVRALQDDAGLSETGDMTPATWRALFDLSATGFSLRDSHIEPMAQRTKVKPWLLTSSGAKAARNPNYDPTVLPVDVNVDVGPGFTHDQIREWARAELATEDNWVGTITLNTGAVIAGEHNPGEALVGDDVLPARALQPGMNLWAPQFMGGTLFHISGVTVSAEGGPVVLAVDTRARDTMKVWQIIERNRESRHHPARAWINQHRSSTITKDGVGEWDAAGGWTTDVACEAEEWTVFPVPAGQEGIIRSLRVRTADDPAEFAMAIFGRKVTPAWLNARVPAPLTEEGTARWESEAVRNRLDNRFLLYAAGTWEEPCGYWPRKSDTEFLTGKHYDDAGVSYYTFAEPVVYVAIWPDRATVVQAGRILWNQLEVGS